MRDTVGRDEVVERRGFQRVGDEPVDSRGVAVGQEHGAGVGAERADEPGAVVLFVAPGFLVLLDDVALVVLDVADGCETGLHMRSHALLVEVKARLALADERAVFLEREKVFARPFIHRIAVWVGLRRQVDLGAIHAEQRVRLARGERGGFLAIDDIVRDAGDFGDEGRRGAETGEGLDAEHRAERKGD